MKRVLKNWIMKRSVSTIIVLTLLGLILIAFSEPPLKYFGLFLFLLAVVLGILFGRIEDLAAKPFTMYIDSGGTLYGAYCPELGITMFGKTEQEAIENLFALARAKIEGILQGKDGPGDERKEIAELVADRLDNVKALFKVVKL